MTIPSPSGTASRVSHDAGGIAARAAARVARLAVLIGCGNQRATLPGGNSAGQNQDEHVKPRVGYHAPSLPPV